MIDLLSIGELLIDFVASVPDVSLADAPGFVKAPGGAPANVAVAASRMGVPAGFIGMVGSDPFGDFLAASLAETGVDVSGLRRSSDARTTLAFVGVRADGKKDIAFYRHPGADARLSPEDLPVEALARCRCLHFGSVSLSLEPARSATFDAAARARQAGAWISFDPNLRPPLWDDLSEAPAQIWRAIAAADIVKIATEEWEFVTGTGDRDAGLARIFDAGPKVCFITDGEAGSFAATPSASASHAGFRVETVDTLGAGDAFVGAMLSELLSDGSIDPLSGERLEAILRIANAAGALTCTRRGVIPVLPERRQVLDFLTENSS